MRIVARRALRDFWEKHPDAEQSLKAWWAEAKAADWPSPAQIKEQYGSASIVGGNRVVFNIAGNKFRLVVKFNYHYRMGYVRFIGTHEAYDKIDVEII